ncbi:MAG: hypothetical protein ACW99U_06500 [Candidatus Thorarchaeota archaeon]
MSDDSDLKETEQAITRYSMQDGVITVMLGLVLIVASGAFLAPWLTVYLAFFVIFGPKALEVFREKYTYPRIGYVQLRTEEEGSRTAAGIFGFIALSFVVTLVAMFLVHGTISADLLYGWIPAWIGTIMIGPSLHVADITGSRFYYVFGFVAVATGYALSILGFDLGTFNVSIYLVGWGLFLVLVGLVTFWRFVRKYPILESEVEPNDGQ